MAAGGLCSLPFFPKLITDKQPTFALDHSHRFVSNLLQSQLLLSDSWKVDVILYIFLLDRFTKSLYRWFTIINDKKNSKMHSFRVL